MIPKGYFNASDPKIPESERYVLVRYTGSRPRSTVYHAPGTMRYLFGQNPDHSQQYVRREDWPRLKSLFWKQLIEIPITQSLNRIPLTDHISRLVLIEIPETVKSSIHQSFETVGELAATPNGLLGTIIGVEYTNVVRGLALTYLGLQNEL